MVGVDEHAYSDYALQWLLEELVDDGDEIVCVRVIEKEIRLSDKLYQDDAQAVMKGILERNGSNRAVSLVLEYAVGKLHATFQKLVGTPFTISLFNPSAWTNRCIIDPNVFARDAYRRNQRSVAWWPTGTGQHSQLILQILPPVLARARRCGSTDREAHEEEVQASQ